MKWFTGRVEYWTEKDRQILSFCIFLNKKTYDS